ncbi:protein-export membrane protein SecF [Candidatus Nomurabacteria bacterium RIFCSPHIGHO2_02_FULL_41_18]|uniref:Protein-export membrane protein SecF n=1 Tax=Candidatus Nomurabacteria bacterium RIFCSPHIGHO2_02_FULL_41_18 TaxID=1801754 RepID=A0A1F6W897_9BACT|nr:MAG: protein-export membrane protein SecF [Candidatus Nomurabacteria bacterium RIFCSPHIGHO2_01_FULL_41_71]OGI78133.1 MAG: protein-export membrane protein SecF [Candidatus Nomurabacteria bacterium RIFCSPHIGHO2_02_FULL_41_18]OGI90315.1 MAG: protein-export membrane protein SecF [Candidatus Nomurabacteria bacterium RIFCSPLOWO2_01_FULL_41_52b]OGJ00550.1 MAG: protein-export membrane protein SecF [Candidatus Nomurabacteria bacterium RIFCSPLOWO2_02_FULL_41_9]
MMFIIKYKKIFISISLGLVVLSLISIFSFGLNAGIDFKGGAITEVVYTLGRPKQADLLVNLESLNLGNILLQPTEEKGYIIKSRDLSESEHIALLEALSSDGQSAQGAGSRELAEISFNSIGPSAGSELARKAIVAVCLVALAIILFIAFSFRRVSRPISSWKYGLIAVGTLLHDVIIPTGIFAALSYYYGAEMDSLFVVAILTILGLSVSDTIVIFDRIRENLKIEGNANKIDFGEIVGRSLEQSFTRSVATSMTVILVLLALVFFGPTTTRYFAILLATGMIVGTYSSIFLASPLLVFWEEWQRKS